MLKILSESYLNRASRACQGLMNMRHEDVMPYQTLVNLSEIHCRSN